MLDDVFERALRSAQPTLELRAVAKELLVREQDRPATMATFEKARQQLREAGREKDEDVVMEVMDFLAGWCSPHVKLVAEQPLNGGGAAAPSKLGG